MKRTVRFTLNSRKFGSQTTVEGVHIGDDNSCELIISVTDGNKILDLSSEITVATMCGTKPDGTTISRPCSIVDNNIVYTLEKQDTAVSGNVLYQVAVVSDDGISQSIIATAKFTVAVMKNIYIPIYRVLESEPSEWSTNYKAYYRLLNNKYTAIADSSCPTFLKDTFYYLVNPNYDSKDDYGAFQSALARVENLIGRASDLKIEFDNINNNIDLFISEYLNAHPELTTTVQDGAISELKIEANLLSKISRNGFLSVIDFKAKGDGTTDDTNAFTDCINCAKAENKNIFIPAGTYVIKGDLPTIPVGIVIAGEDVGQAAYINKPSVTTIIDARNSTEYLFRQASDGSSRNGGEIRNIYFLNAKLSNGSYVANEDGNGYCLYIYRGGWDGLISNCTFDSYRTALQKGGDDYRVNNCKFHKCGTLVDSDSIDYAVELVDSCNETLFNSCHFEHCRFFVRVANTVRNTTNMCFNNVFNSCKFESSMKGLTINSSLSPIYVKSKNLNPAVLFTACRFIQMDIDAYTHDDTYSNIPYFMDVTQCTVNSSQFVCGLGSGGANFTKNYNALYLNATKSQILDCRFMSACKQKSPINLNGSQFTNNHIRCDYKSSDNDMTAVALVEYDINSIVDNNVYEGNATNQMCMQRYFSHYDFIGNAISSMPALSVFGHNRYHFGENKTIAIRKATNSLCVQFGITLKSWVTNSIPVGRFVIKIIFTSSDKTASIISRNEMSMNGKELPVNVYFIDDELLYIQIPERASLHPYSVLIDGLEGATVNAYIANIGDTITESIKTVNLLLK